MTDGISRRRLRASRLTGDRFATPAQVVGWHLAMQAQEYGPAKWSIGQRSDGLVDADVERAVAEGSIVRTHVLRPTWHFLSREDYRWVMALSGPRVQQGNAGRMRQLDLDARTLGRAERAIGNALEGGAQLTRDQLTAVLDARRIDRDGQRMPFILMHLELEAVIASGARAGRHHAYALVDERIPAAAPLERERAIVELVRRYLGSHGPATVKDLSWWSGLTMRDLRRALGDLGDEVTSERVDALELWSLVGEDRPPPARGVQLLQVYDELVVGYTESRFAGDPAKDVAKAAWYDRTYPTGLFLLGERVGGHWRRTIRRDDVHVDVHFYRAAAPTALRAVAAATRALGRFLGLPVHVDHHRFSPTSAR